VLARVEEEREVRPRGDEDDERVHRDLAEQERPVVGEDVAERLPDQRRRPAAGIEEADGLPDHRRCTPHQAGPTGPENPPPARRTPSASTESGSCGSGRPAGPNSTVPPVAGSNVE